MSLDFKATVRRFDSSNAVSSSTTRSSMDPAAAKCAFVHDATRQHHVSAYFVRQVTPEAREFLSSRRVDVQFRPSATLAPHLRTRVTESPLPIWRKTLKLTVNVGGLCEFVLEASDLRGE